MARFERAFSFSDTGMEKIEGSCDLIPQVGIVSQPFAHAAQPGDADKVDHHAIITLGEDQGNGKPIKCRDPCLAGRHDRSKHPRIEAIDRFILEDQQEATLRIAVQIELFCRDLSNDPNTHVGHTVLFNPFVVSGDVGGVVILPAAGAFRADLGEDAFFCSAGDVDAHGARFIQKGGIKGHGSGAAGGGHGGLRFNGP
jgi:hypothetical protein